MPAASHHHARHHRAGYIQQTLHVGVDHLFPVLNLAHVELFQPPAQTGVVHQNVDLTPVGRQLINGCLNRKVIAHIQVDAMDGMGAPLARSKADFGQLTRASGSQDEPAALHRKRHRACGADAAARARNQNCFVP